MAHTYTSIHVHVVFSTKRRFPFISDAVKPELHAYMIGILKNLGTRPAALGGIADHVHAVVEIPPALSVSELVGKLKGNASRWLNASGRSAKFEWQEGFSAFSVSQSNLDRVIAYVRTQEEHHRRMTFAEELDRLFERHGVVRR